MNGSERAAAVAVAERLPRDRRRLRASPIWDASAFDWLRPFESAAEIRAELLALKEQRGFQPLKLPNWASKHQKKAADGAGAVSHDAGDWNVFYLFLHEEVRGTAGAARSRRRCSRRRAILGRANRAPGAQLFDAHPDARIIPRVCRRCRARTSTPSSPPLTPGTHILKHHGPTNKKLRIHLPLIGVLGFRAPRRRHDDLLRAGSAARLRRRSSTRRGTRAMTRLVLVFDVWHPDLSDKEVHFLSFLQRARMKASRKMGATARRGRGEGEGGGARVDEGGDGRQLLPAAARREGRPQGQQLVEVAMTSWHFIKLIYLSACAREDGGDDRVARQQPHAVDWMRRRRAAYAR